MAASAAVLRAVAGDDADPVAVVLDPAHRASQDDPVAELGGDRLGDADRSAGDPVLLRSPVDRDERLQVGVGVRVEQRVQQRDIAGLGGPHPLADDAEVGASRLGAQVAADPALPGLPVEDLGIRGEPRPLQVGALGEAGEAQQALGEVGERKRRDARDGALVRLHQRPLALQVEQQLSLVVPGAERRQSQLADQLVHAGVALAEPLPAELERRAVVQHQALGAPADALAGLDHGHLVPGRHEPPGGGQPGQPGADDDDIYLSHDSLPRIGRMSNFLLRLTHETRRAQGFLTKICTVVQLLGG